MEEGQLQLIIYGSTGALFILIFLLFIIYDIIIKTIEKCKRKKEEQLHDNISIDLRILIYSNILLTFIYMNSLLLRFILPLNNHCILISKLTFTLFQLTRTAMFVIFIRRLQVTYLDTVFELKRKYIYLLYSAIAIYFIPYICYINWSYVLIDSQYSPQFHSCSLIYTSSVLFFVISILDLLILLSCLYLFIFPLYKLIRHQDDNVIKNQLYNVIIKISILYSSAIFSSIILTTISFIFPFGFYYGVFDSLINGLLLILLHPIHNTCYKKICCVLHKCCIKCCNTFQTAEQNKPETNPKQKHLKHLKLAKIIVLENVPSNNIQEVQIQSPINILLYQGINNMNKKAAQNGNDNNEPPNRKTKTPPQNLEKKLDKMYKNAAVGKPAQMHSGRNVIQQTSLEIRSPSNSVRETMKTNVIKRFNHRMKLNPFNESIDYSCNNSKIQLEHQKSKTLQLIDFESYHL